jgi:phosphatidylinositol glycan class W
VCIHTCVVADEAKYAVLPDSARLYRRLRAACEPLPSHHNCEAIFYVHSTILRSQVAALGLRQCVLRSSVLTRVLPLATVDLLSIVVPTCGACFCKGQSLALFCILLLLPLASESWKMGLPLLSKQSVSEKADALRALNSERPPAITQLRGAIALQTAFCILAVDFAAFPRANAKSLSVGCTLMDLGSGAVVLAGALTPRRRPRGHGGGGGDHGPATSASGHASKLPTELPRRAFGPRQMLLALLGVGRLVAVQATGYPQDADEYGTHWNLFFTLAAVAVLTPLFERVAASDAGCLCLASIGLCLHQASLSCGLMKFVELAPREGLFSANKEGIASLPGYICLDLLGRGLSGLLLRHRRSSAAAWQADLLRLLALDAVLWLAAWCADSFLQGTSRRVCNAAYVLWVCAQVLLALWLSLVRLLWQPMHPPAPVFDAINRHPLSFFLVANAFTGTCNLAAGEEGLRKLDGTTAAAILGAYMAVLCVGAMALCVDTPSPSPVKQHRADGKAWSAPARRSPCRRDGRMGHALKQDATAHRAGRT